MPRPVEHRKLRESWDVAGHAHELTFSTDKRRPILLLPGVADAFLKVLDQARRQHSFELWAYVVMPEHVHLLVAPKGEEYSMAEILKAIKIPASKAIFELHPRLREECRVPRNGRPDEFRLWLPGGGYDRNVVTTRTVSHVIRYIHANPFRRGLCDEETDWPWSSRKAYLGEETPIPVDIPWSNGT
ncbi:transposase [bacterium]|nr:MAG: transposase [bacterium]